MRPVGDLRAVPNAQSSGARATPVGGTSTRTVVAYIGPGRPAGACVYRKTRPMKCPVTVRRILAVVATQRLVDGSAWLLGGVARGIAALLT